MRVGTLFSSVATVAILAGSLSFGGVAYGRGAVDLTPKTAWSVNNVQDASSSESPYCTLAKRFTGDLVVTFAENYQGESSFALDFPQGNFNAAETFSITLDPGAGQRRVFNVGPATNRAFILRLGRDDRFFQALGETGNLSAIIGGQAYNFDVSDIKSGRVELSACIARISPSPQPQQYDPQQSYGYVADVPPAIGEIFVRSQPALEAPAPIVIDPAPILPVAQNVQFVPVLPSAADDAPVLLGGGYVAAPEPDLPMVAGFSELPPLPLLLNDTPFPDDEVVGRELVMPPGIGFSEAIVPLVEVPVDDERVAPAAFIDIANVSGAASTAVPPTSFEREASTVSVENPRYSTKISAPNSDIQSIDLLDAPFSIERRGVNDAYAGASKSDLRLQRELSEVRNENDVLKVSLDSLTKDLNAYRALSAARVIQSEEFSSAPRFGSLKATNVKRVTAIPVAKGKTRARVYMNPEDISAGIAAVQGFTDVGLHNLYDRYGDRSSAKKKESVVRVDRFVDEVLELDEVKEMVPEAADVVENIRDNQYIEIEVEQLLEVDNAEGNAVVEGIEGAVPEVAESSPPPAVENAGGSNVGAPDVDVNEAVVAPQQIIKDEFLLLEEVLEPFDEVVEDGLMLGIRSAQAEEAPPAMVLNESQRNEIRLMESLRQEFETKPKKIEPVIVVEELVAPVVETTGIAEVDSVSSDVVDIEELLAPVNTASQALDVVRGSNEIIEVEKLLERAVVDASLEADPESVVNGTSSANAPVPAIVAGEPSPLLETDVAATSVVSVVEPAVAGTDFEGVVAVPRSRGIEGLLYAAGIHVSGDVELLEKASIDGVKVYQWKTESLYGSAEQRRLDNAYDFDDMALVYLERTQARCLGEFAVVPGVFEERGGRRVDAYEIACVSEGGDSSASLIFFSADGVFSVVAHEADIANMSAAMDVRDRIMGSII